MSRTVRYVIIALILCQFATAQNTGFMGNRILFNMEASISPAWKNENVLSNALVNLDEKTQRYLGLNYFLSPNVECIVWRKGTIGAGYNYFTTPYSGDMHVGFEYQSSHEIFYENSHYKGNVVAHGFNVFYKQYLGDTRAPMGHYVRLTLDGYFYKFEADGFGQWTSFYHPEYKRGNEMLFGVKAEYGYDMLFFNRLKISMGMTLGTVFGGYKAVKSSFDDFYWDSDDATTLTMRDRINNRILNAYWFGVKLGVGVLAF